MLIIYCDGGLGNRLNGLLGGAVLAHSLQLDFVVSWPVNRWCGAELVELFDVPFASDTRAMPEIAAAGAASLITHDPQLFRHDALVNPNHFGSFSRLLGAIRRLRDKEGRRIYFNSTVPPYFPADLLRSVVEKMKVKQPYVAAADAFMQRHALSSGGFWGLHLRGTDGTASPLYYRWWRACSRAVPGRVLLCSDDAGIQQRFARPGKVIHRSAILPSRAMAGHGWNARSTDEYGRSFNYNISRSGESIRDAMIDFVLLGRSKLLYTSQSTFLENAARFGQPQSIGYRLCERGLAKARFHARRLRAGLRRLR